MEALRIVIDVFIGISVFFAFAGVVGMLRMPDAFCRMQSSTNISTLGVLGVIIGGILHSLFILGDSAFAIKLGIMGIFYIVTSPIAGHAIAKGAYRHGVRPDKKMSVDKYGEDLVEDLPQETVPDAVEEEVSA
ncbi:MAG: monovalent cation/H(+) antiporter subunit G [Lachnospiraceae bacterium]|nr:monovalent cation/H(+) antiporter subunit G [Lachnospiraceae bacterium]MBQ6903892.1 monovalent cation/H(+) antiporter subunit G [Lachnospiraceae bacterium]MBR0091607.1 monovalent cation/H(+) antiporter subunit G [Lachnospiraceae bacterium]